MFYLGLTLCYLANKYFEEWLRLLILAKVMTHDSTVHLRLLRFPEEPQFMCHKNYFSKKIVVGVTAYRQQLCPLFITDKV